MSKDKTNPKYNPAEVEPKWQKKWEDEKLYLAENFAKKPKFYTLIEFPYPSGVGLHVGHVRSWSAMDAYSRKKRMTGHNVLYPIGWDAFGLPAENYAIKNKIHPSVAVEKNIATFKRQVKSLGLSFDWSREVNTTDPKYYKWTQWIFLKFFEKNLAYQADVPVNWCPSCKTNLADEEVLPDGTHERCGSPTEKRMQKQWILKITRYAQRLIDDLKTVDYSPMIAQQQVNWIGRKTGISIKYKVSSIKHEATSDGGRPSLRGHDSSEVESYIECFTTRPDTNFGATFIVIGPEHPFAASLLSRKIQAYSSSEAKGRIEKSNSNNSSRLRSNSKLDDIMDYVEKAKKKSEIDRIAEGRKKTGVFTGFYAINNLNGKKLPIWISDFVLGHVGTGAVVGVPAHDSRDYDFAKAFGLPIEVVVLPGKNSKFNPSTKLRARVQNTKLQFKIKNEWREGAYEGDGITVNSSFLDGLPTEEAKEKIMDYLEEKGFGKRVTTYHLRDWVFSRQHYWGEPIPIIHCKNCGVVPVPEKDLPVELPYLEQYEPSGTGESPLAKVTDWVNIACPECKDAARRETDTMPNWAGSNWYYLAYLFANKLGDQKSKIKNQRSNKDYNIFKENQDVINYWMPIDIYQGGFEHTTLHLLYSRFVYKFLYDIGVVPTPEPYAKRRSHGIVLGPDGRKMSKSYGNVINPDEIANKFGADTLRVYEMFMGPFDQTIAWSEEGVEGCFRFLKRVWQLAINSKFKVQSSKFETSSELLVSLNKTIKKVGEDIETLKFNTAVASMMEFINAWQKDEKGLHKEDLMKFLLILSPFAPHLTEELWQSLKTDGKSIHSHPWPSFDPKLLQEEEVIIVVQVNGKVRDTLRLRSGQAQKVVEQRVKESEKVRKYLKGKKIVKVVYIEGKIINFVVND